MALRRQALLAAAACAALAVSACASSREAAPQFEPARFQAWNDQAPSHRLYPGDEIAVTVYTADELSQTVTVGPDGRANLPMIGGVMVSERSESEAARAIAQRYASVLRDPIVEVRATGFASQNVLVGGEVAEPGLYALPDARTGALEAVLLAGGFETTARRREVVILRRGANGQPMMRTVNLSDALRGGAADSVPLARGDIVFVPRSSIAEVGLFIEQYVTNIVPINQAFGYALANEVFND